MNWVSFTIAFLLCVILPVWMFTFIELSFFYKIAFTLAGGVGIYVALEYGSMRRRG